MFGFSLTKLIVLVAAILAVWYGFKYVSRLQYQREERARLRDEINRRESVGRATEAEDMAACPSCKAYVPAKGARNCGRPDCPF
jgi:uncharacterized protein